MMMPGAGILRGVNLSEAQRDRVFAILHAQAPQMRAQALEAQTARQALQQVALAGELDEAKLQDLAQRRGDEGDRGAGVDHEPVGLAVLLARLD